MDDTASTSQGSFARSTGLPSWMGKATSELKTRVPDMVGDDFNRLANSLGLSASELLREMVMLRLYGREQVERMHAQRLALVAGSVPQTGLQPTPEVAG